MFKFLFQPKNEAQAKWSIDLNKFQTTIRTPCYLLMLLFNSVFPVLLKLKASIYNKVKNI